MRRKTKLLAKNDTVAAIAVAHRNFTGFETSQPRMANVMAIRIGAWNR